APGLDESSNSEESTIFVCPDEAEVAQTKAQQTSRCKPPRPPSPHVHPQEGTVPPPASEPGSEGQAVPEPVPGDISQDNEGWLGALGAAFDEAHVEFGTQAVEAPVHGHYQPVSMFGDLLLSPNTDRAGGDGHLGSNTGLNLTPGEAEMAGREGDGVLERAPPVPAPLAVPGDPEAEGEGEGEGERERDADAEAEAEAERQGEREREAERERGLEGEGVAAEEPANPAACLAHATRLAVEVVTPLVDRLPHTSLEWTRLAGLGAGQAQQCELVQRMRDIIPLGGCMV
ncbi:hypothetical protein KIPB_012978, partial [Kipferlia bialata]